MGPYRAAALALGLLAGPAEAIEPGWHYSPLPGEGDRASLGCDRAATEGAFTCLAVRCEDDFSTGLYIHASAPEADGRWEMTIDRENFSVVVEASTAPYAARVVGGSAPLLERLKQGTFVYLRPAADVTVPFAYIDLAGSLYAITEALHWCAPRNDPTEQNAAPGVDPQTQTGDQQ